MGATGEEKGKSGFLCLISFSLVEPRDGETSVATFTVERSRGTFTDVTVIWEVVGGGADLQPTAGVVSFAEGQSTGSFEINILPDNVSYSKYSCFEQSYLEL